jgi:hypothetical protein
VGAADPDQFALEDYPYIMDFQPKKRELYEIATDTSERMSRSLEEINVGKSSGTTKSNEVLDVDMGGSESASGSIGVAGFSIGGGGSSSRSGQWGTKSVASGQSGLSRTTDESHERRETQSHTTQISQMYHQFNSYHLGTNRTVFFIEPRPHVLDAPSGFVRGPREVEGIQEIFVVVNQPKDLEELAVSVRLDTSHYLTRDVMDYERKTSSEVFQCSASMLPPTQEDTEKERIGDQLLPRNLAIARYHCYIKRDTQSATFTPPQGYIIEGYEITSSSASGPGSNFSVTVDPEGRYITLKCVAVAKQCFFFYEEGFHTDPPATYFTEVGNASLTIVMKLRSESKTIKVASEDAIMITSRGLCCGAEVVDEFLGPRIVKMIPLKRIPTPAKIAPLPLNPSMTGTPDSNFPAIESDNMRQVAKGTSALEANEISRNIHSAMLGNMSGNDLYSTNSSSIVDTGFFSEKFMNVLKQDIRGRPILAASSNGYFNPEAEKKLSKFFAADLEKVARSQILEIETKVLSRVTGLDEISINRVKMHLMGVPTRSKYRENEKDAKVKQSDEKN